jgi:hypothetical protein
MDLDLDHYNYTDLVTLFKLPMPFTAQELKNARKIVIAVHPDKSNLDKSVFIFYHKAYTLLESIFKHNIRANADLNADHASFSDVLDEYNDTSRQDVVNKFSKSATFQQTFNDLFETTYVRTNDGYDDWFRNDTEVPDFANLKTSCSTLAKTHFNPYSSTSTYSDLKDIYTTNTVIGVNETDYVDRPMTLEALQMERGSIAPLSKHESQQILQKQHELEEMEAVERTFQLKQEQATMQTAQRSFWSKFMLLM